MHFSSAYEGHRSVIGNAGIRSSWATCQANIGFENLHGNETNTEEICEYEYSFIISQEINNILESIRHFGNRIILKNGSKYLNSYLAFGQNYLTRI